jgi:tetratricopeptide (TPR) repeat protein
MKTLYILSLSVVLLILSISTAGQLAAENRDTTSFNVKTYDDKVLPAQIIHPENSNKKLLLFINGSTPYDEKGHIGANWTDKGDIIAFKHEFYIRFLNVMVNKGYPVATMAKRSFIYPTDIPRPSFADLSLDIYYYILELKRKGYIHDEKDLVIVGYSEGSVVATKVLSYLKTTPYACVLLGSGSHTVNYNKISVEDFYMTDILRKTNNWSDEQILTEINQMAQMNDTIRNMDEAVFENEYKKSRPFGFGFADWESYYIDKEYPLYNSVPNLVYANIPVLICIGDQDKAMPLKSARSTYEQLLEWGMKKATFRVIDDEVHQYNKYDVFAIIDTWIGSGFTSTEFTLNARDSISIKKYKESKEMVHEISALSYYGGQPEQSILCYRKALENKYMENSNWFTLGVKLFANSYHDEAFEAFKRSNEEGFIVRFASLTWMGHIKDLENERQEALGYYEQALSFYPGFPVQHDIWNIIIDKTWIEERIKLPFKGVN